MLQDIKLIADANQAYRLGKLSLTSSSIKSSSRPRRGGSED